MSMTRDETAEQHLHLLKLAEDPNYRAAYLHQTATARMLVDELFYPFSASAIEEALSNLPASEYVLLAEKMATPARDLYCIRTMVYEYWYAHALAAVEREISR